MTFWQSFKWGFFRYKFPLCCVIEFCIREYFGQEVSAAVGCWMNPECKAEFVHCFMHRFFCHKPVSLGGHLRIRKTNGRVYSKHTGWVDILNLQDMRDAR